MTKGTAILDLPPAPPAYVEGYEVVSTRHCEHRLSLALGDCGTVPPGAPPHDHEHAEQEPRPPRTINVSDTLSMTEYFTVALNPEGT